MAFAEGLTRRRTLEDDAVGEIEVGAVVEEALRVTSSDPLKIGSRHFEGLAVVYVSQSTEQQFKLTNAARRCDLSKAD